MFRKLAFSKLKVIIAYNYCVLFILLKQIDLHNTEKLELLTPFLLELENIQPLPIDLKSLLVNDAEILHATKGDIILSEGEICKYAWVVLKGIIRSFHYVGESEVTSSLMKPHHIVISVESFHTQTPAFESLEALQSSLLARIHYQQLEKLYQQFPDFNYTGRRLTEQYLFLMEERLYLLRKHKAIDKYKFFLKNYPGLINEIPLKYIASFLGINQETLSRVRNKIR